MAAMTKTSRGRHDGGLPAEVTSFVGRRHEVAEVRRLLAVSRVVTLTGPGGVGKTRLAIRAGQEVRRAFRDGVWLVELAALPVDTRGAGTDLVARAVAGALDVPDRSAAPPLTVLTNHLRGRQALVILDNCEHQLAPCAVLADTVLRAAPEVRILATSRQPLGITGEQTLPVPPLSLPDCEAPHSSLEAFTQGEAVRLFAERGRAAHPGFAVTEDNRDVVCRIVRRLDGLPLAIELAAVRLRALSARQLLDRLDERFRLLSAGSRAVLPRHQTLRALIDWSYALCSQEEQLLWRRVSVFAGDLDLEAAETICSGDGIARRDVVDLLIGLVDKCVLTRDDHQESVRYRMLETLRAYGAERLARCGEADTLRGRHRDYYRGLAGLARAEFFGPMQLRWLRRLQAEHANLRAALESSLTEPGTREDGLSMATDLLYHWLSSDHLGEGRGWLERGLAVVRSPGPTRGRALWTAAWLAVIQGDITSAAAMLREGRSIGERLGDDSILMYVELFDGQVAMCEDRAEEGLRHLERALERHCCTGDPTGLALTLIRVSLAHSFLGHPERAVAAGRECLAVCEAHGEGWHRAYMMMALGVDLWRQGELKQALGMERKSLAFNRSLGDLLGAGITVEVLAWIAASREEFQRAARLLGIAGTVWATLGARMSGFGYLAGYHDACEDRTRAALGERAFEAAVERGARLDREEALAYALQEEQPARDQGGGAEEPARLTRRERQIAELVAQGLTNKEIAASLVIAQRTAEGHVEHILTKLGFTSRAQIAVWVRDEGSAGQG
ncbi:ATP-binding protein [Streptosporangium pseudovulgare]|uniref:LuxR family transcriptional regulator n=1 Tax=Streptosporangium pseudovulgare TaxID=35765 RepID=A0ABQ2R7B1_9ACTN|nr:LuxR C-terminal-related transcriptional regulator [Streptosporangium pseudovulgare]GGQ17511.1 LuxR family transcriptional regulator [Streptosporangium pseudovulgare]